MKHYDVIVIGAGPGGIFATYELVKEQPCPEPAPRPIRLS